MAIPGYYSLLQRGSSGPDVALVQTWLNGVRDACTWYDALKADGKFGASTQRAVQEFQLKNKMNMDGKVGQNTWNVLYTRYTAKHGLKVPYPGIVLHTGCSGGTVRLVQQKLNSLGERLTADGRFGAATAAAVQRFQRYFGLTADGVVGRTTWQKLYEVYNDIANRLLSSSLRPGEYPGVLRSGSTGTAVRELQFYLYLMSAYQSSIPSVSIDGRFGAATEAAVRAYQRFAGLTVDGIVGRKTWDSLYLSLIHI